MTIDRGFSEQTFLNQYNTSRGLLLKADQLLAPTVAAYYAEDAEL